MSGGCGLGLRACARVPLNPVLTRGPERLQQRESATWAQHPCVPISTGIGKLTLVKDHVGNESDGPYESDEQSQGPYDFQVEADY